MPGRPLKYSRGSLEHLRYRGGPSVPGDLSWRRLPSPLFCVRRPRTSLK